MMCLPTRFEVNYFPQGFPDELLDKLRAFSGRDIVCNKPYSGTEVLKDYGEHQLATGDLIVYTSGDSVLQIAAHEDVIPRSSTASASTRAPSSTAPRSPWAASSRARTWARAPRISPAPPTATITA